MSLPNPSPGSAKLSSYSFIGIDYSIYDVYAAGMAVVDNSSTPTHALESAAKSPDTGIENLPIARIPEKSEERTLNGVMVATGIGCPLVCSTRVVSKFRSCNT